MTKLTLELFDDLYSTMAKIRAINDGGIEIEIPEGSIIFENILNLKLLKKEAERSSKILHFITFDSVGQSMINMLEEDSGSVMHGGFVSKEITTPAFENTIIPNPSSYKPASINLLSAFFLKLKDFKPSFGNGSRVPKLGILGGIVLIVFIGLWFFMSKNHKADIKIVMNAQPLTKSVTIKVVKDGTTNVDSRILKGFTVENNINESSSTPTTGTILEGKRASGKVRIYNKTDTDMDLEEGDILIYDDDDDELQFTLDEDVTVPARTEEGEPPVITPGSVEVEATAVTIGDASNIEEGEKFTLDDHKKSDFEATVIEDFTGGKSESVKAVAEVDKTKTIELVTAAINSVAPKSLEQRAGSGQKIIAGSQVITVISDSYSAKVGDKADKLELTRSSSVAGLAYSEKDLNSLLDQVSGDLIPDGYEISTRDRDVNVEVLGKTATTNLSSTEADIQVTLKSYVVPIIDPDKIKTELGGKSKSAAAEILGKLQNIKTYDVKISPNFLFFGNIPKAKDKIFIETTNE